MMSALREVGSNATKGVTSNCIKRWFSSRFLLVPHICPGHTDKSRGANSKKCYLCINFWRLVVKLFQFLKLFSQPFLRYGNPNRIFMGTLKNKFQVFKLLMF